MTPGDPLDEQRLEAELQAAEIAARAPRWNWGWVNKPITLWVLSTIAVGILTFTYTQFSVCRTSVEADSARFFRLIEELSFRSGGIYGVAKGPDSNLAAVVSALDPGKTFLFAEFKDKLPNELVAEARQFLRKWHPRELAAHEAAGREWTTELMKRVMPGSGDDTQPLTVTLYLDLVLKQSARPRGAPTVASMAAPGGVFDLLNAWTLVYRALRTERRGESLGAVSEWARVLVNGFAAYTTDDAQLQLASTGTCLKRSFWPFS